MCFSWDADSLKHIEFLKNEIQLKKEKNKVLFRLHSFY